MSDAQQKIEDKIQAAVTKSVMKDEVAAQPSAARPIAAEVIKAIVPILVHLSSNEKWWQSRVTLGALAAAVAGILSLFGFVYTSDDQKLWVEVVFQLAPVILSLGGGALAWYGRWKAKKPLGS